MDEVRCTTDLNRSFDYDFKADQTEGEGYLNVHFDLMYWPEIRTVNTMCKGDEDEGYCENLQIRYNRLG